MAGSPIIDIDLLTPSGVQVVNDFSATVNKGNIGPLPDNTQQTKNSKSGKSRVFETRPQVKVTEVETVKKNMF